MRVGRRGEGGGGITSVSRLSHFNVLYSRKIWWRIVVWQIGDRTAKFISAKSVCARYRVKVALYHTNFHFVCV